MSTETGVNMGTDNRFKSDAK